MPRQYTREENERVRKKSRTFRYMGIVFLAGLLSGAIYVGIRGKLKENQKIANKGLEARVVQTDERDEQKEKPRIIDYKTEDFSKDTDVILLARMLYGEARNCNKEEKIAVAYTAINRVNDGKKWNGETLREVILKPKQYSCFNKGDINYNKLKDPIGNHEKYFRKNTEIFNECLEVAEEVLSGKYQELNFGQTHYFNPKVVRPSWADKLEKVEIRNSKHDFYIEN